LEHLLSYADNRLIASCVFCGAQTETRDHCPSRILLDEPYPTHLPVVPACLTCNTGFSLDEQYFACLVECARTGSTVAVERPKIRRILDANPALAGRLQNARTVASDGGISFEAENARIRAVVLKLAQGHAAYEVSEIVRHEPSHFLIMPLHLLTPESRKHFETPPSLAGWPEVGSRAMQRMFLQDGFISGPGWIEVQEERYRYLAVAEGAVKVRIVIGEYLACEVIWSDD
jgi:hypothetical protein